MEKIKNFTALRDGGSIEIQTTENAYIFEINRDFMQHKNGVQVFKDVYIERQLPPHNTKSKFLVLPQKMTSKEKENLKSLLETYTPEIAFLNAKQEGQMEMRNRCLDFLHSNLEAAAHLSQPNTSEAQMGFINGLANIENIAPDNSDVIQMLERNNHRQNKEELSGYDLLDNLTSESDNDNSEYLE